MLRRDHGAGTEEVEIFRDTPTADECKSMNERNQSKLALASPYSPLEKGTIGDYSDTKLPRHYASDTSIPQRCSNLAHDSTEWRE